MRDEDNNKLILKRKSKLALLRKGGNPFINNFKPENLAQNIIQEFKSFSKEELEKKICKYQ